MNQQGTFKLATVGGIEVKAHWSWVLVLLLFTFQFAEGYFPQEVPGAGTLTYIFLGFISSILLFVSVLLHEFSHSFMAQARGYKVRDITLFIFGGVSSIEEEARTAWDEFIIAFVGPLTSFVLAGVFYVLAQVILAPGGDAGLGAGAVMQNLALINLLLGAFNMIPGFPLDGGRVLRSIIWGVTHNPRTATRFAVLGGQLVAYGFMLWGLLIIFQGNFFNGIWLAFIGWFLLSAAQQSGAGSEVRDRLKGLTVGQLMEPAQVAVSPYMSLAQLLTQYILPYNLRSLPVIEPDGRLVGVITLGNIRDVPQEQWGAVIVGQIMTGADRLQVARPQDPLNRAVQALMDGQFDQLPVVDAYGRLVGVLTREHILHWMQIRDELNVPPSGQGQPAPPQPGYGGQSEQPMPPQGMSGTQPGPGGVRQQ